MTGPGTNLTRPEASLLPGPGTYATGPTPPGAARHGSIRLIEPSCTSCMVCARECPTWCITIDSHAETVAPEAPGARPRTTHVLDRFAIDWSLCMYCGICVDECPFDALAWADDAVPAGAQLLQELAAGPGPSG